MKLKTQVTTAILKNQALAIPWVRRYRGSRSAYVTMDRTLDVFRKTTTVYQTHLEAAGIAPHWIAGKHVLDVGSGAHLGVCLWFLAQEAASTTAVDRFRDLLPDGDLRRIHVALADSWPSPMRRRVEPLLSVGTEMLECGDRPLIYRPWFPIEKAAGKLRGMYDLLVSFNVLGYVTDLRATFESMYALLAPGGMMIHRVHHGTHGPTEGVRGGWLHQYTYGARIWRLMYSNRGGPNRQPASSYRRACVEAGFSTVELDPVQRVSAEEIRRERPVLAPEFQQWSDEDLATHASVLTARKATDCAHAEAAPPADGDHA